MGNAVFSEYIYVKRSKGKLGAGATTRECILETHWLPYRAENGFVELYPVMDNLQNILKILERIPVDVFKEQYSAKADSREIYLELKKMVR